MPSIETYACPYLNDGRRITAPGRFEGEPVFAPYYWEIALEGLADSERAGCYVFRFTGATEDFRRHPTLKAWLGRRRTLRLRQDDQGFIHCL